jgi:hypothetical protein
MGPGASLLCSKVHPHRMLRMAAKTNVENLIIVQFGTGLNYKILGRTGNDPLIFSAYCFDLKGKEKAFRICRSSLSDPFLQEKLKTMTS